MLASMTAAVTGGEPAGSYLGPHHCYLRQLDDVGAHRVEHVLQLVYDGDKSLHVRGVWGNKTNEAAPFVMEPKSFNVPLKPPLRQHPGDCAGSCSPLADSRSGFGNGKKLQDLRKYRESWRFRACAFCSLDDGTSCVKVSHLGWLVGWLAVLFEPFAFHPVLSQRIAFGALERLYTFAMLQFLVSSTLTCRTRGTQTLRRYQEMTSSIANVLACLVVCLFINDKRQSGCLDVQG